MTNRKFAHFMGSVARITAVVAIAVVGVTGCGGGGKTSSGGGQSDEVPRIAGDWSGTVRIVSGGPACGGSVRLSLTQRGPEIGGSYSVTLFNCGVGTASGPLEGAWAAERQRFVLTDGEGAEYVLLYSSAKAADGSVERLRGTVTEGNLVTELSLFRIVRD